MRERQIAQAIMQRMAQAEGKEGSKAWGKYMRTLRRASKGH